MSLEQTIKDTLIAESVDLDMRLQQLVRAGLMPSNTIPLLRKAITKIQGGYPLQGAEREVMANFLNSMMFIVLGDDAIFNKARVGAKSYATEAKEKQEYDYEGDMDEEKMPFKGPYKKAGERKDEYGNTIKNVAKHLAKKAMKANDEGNKVVANTNDPESMKKYTADVVKRARDARKALTKESRRTEALADIAAVAQMNESYKTTFDAALTQYGIKSPSELDEEKRKEFFNFVDQNYKKGDN